MRARTGGGAFDWNALVAQVIHPVKVAIIEALEWTEKPLSATELRRAFGDSRLNTSRISYHLTTLGQIGVLEVVSRRYVRGATENFYFFR
jgi:hypothetical protein